MDFSLINPINSEYSPIEQVLTNRGLFLDELPNYLNTTDSVINSFSLFGMSILSEAASALIIAIQNEQDALIVVDADCDGFTSSAILMNWLYKVFPAWTTNHLDYFLHEGKQHGLSDVDINQINPDIKLILIPDASSNDYEYHKELRELGCKIIVLDHHNAEKISEDAIVINNQLSNYPNKQLSGAGVTWQFCRYMDALLGQSIADDYLDLVALGMDADMMSLLSLETKHLINKGLKNLRNPFITAMVDKNSFAMGGKVTPMTVAFYIAPYVNAITRSGTLQEKEVVFQSMLDFKAYKKIPSNKRGHQPGEMEAVYVQAVRTVTNVKNRQTRAQEAGLQILEEMIETQNLLSHKVLLFKLKPGTIDKNISGLIANKLMSKYQRPCCVLTEVIAENGEVSYQGSARGCDRTGVTNFQQICKSTECIMYAEGHNTAFGLGILEKDIDSFLNRTDEILKDIKDEAVYFVDFVYHGVNIEPSNILDIARFDDLWGKDVEEPFVAFKNLKVTADMLTLMSPDKRPTLKITLPNRISLIKFGSSQEEYNSLYSEHGCVEINLVGRCSANEWNGNLYPQILIEDYEIIDRAKYVF